MKKILFTGVYVICWLLSASLLAQPGSKIDIVQGGDYMAGGMKDSIRYDKFVGNPQNRVIFKQKTTTIYCDSAFLFRALNRVEAYGNVKVVEKDTITVTGHRLIYEGNVKLARMTDNVVYKDPSLTIETDTMQYDMLNNLASYIHYGTLWDDRNTLNSEIGNYHTVTKLASFKNDVVLENPDNFLYTDTLQYNTISKIAYFRGPTTIISREDSTILTFEDGQYLTTAKQSLFGRGRIETDSYILYGDTLFFDDLNQYYSAKRNVQLVSKEDDLVILGEDGRYWKAEKRTEITGNPILKKRLNLDTLFMAADTLVSIDDTVQANKRVLAYNHVRIYKDNLQGKADSLAYFVADSTINFYQDPVLWNQDNQIEADSIFLLLNTNGIDRMFMNANAFLITEDTLNNYNQIKGRRMVANFLENALDRLNVYGNGESILFALDETETVVIGMNKILCSDMIIRFEESNFSNASFYTKPEASFIPPHEIEPPAKRLKGFNWRIAERPAKADIFLPAELYNAKMTEENATDQKAQSPAIPENVGAPPPERPERLNPENIQR